VWLREHAVKYPFVRRSVSRFMPGETLDAALEAARTLQQKSIGTVFTHLGENVADRAEARRVAEHYLEVLARVHELKLPAEVSVKLTQLGLDLSLDFCFENLERIIQREVSLDRSLLAGMARAALDRLGEYGSATIRLHPEDFAAIGARATADGPVRIVADALVPRGGSLVQSDFGFMDASPEAQFRELARALLSEMDAPAEADATHGIVLK